jgi:para-aminobenzoate synthetase component I
MPFSILVSPFYFYNGIFKEHNSQTILKRIFKTYNLAAQPENHACFIRWAVKHSEHVVYLTSSGFNLDPWSQFEATLAIGAYRDICSGNNDNAFELLKDFSKQNREWMFGFMSYDLKNQLENLHSENPDGIKMPLMHFFIPDILIMFKGNVIEIGIMDELKQNHEELFKEMLSCQLQETSLPVAEIHHRVSREDYINKVDQIRSYIQKGDIYEANYCIEFFSENSMIDPVNTFLKLNKNNPAPFACFYRIKDKYLLSSSPERFLAKRGNKLISQPIKGTIRRGITPDEDDALKHQLQNNPKERSENIMIVDLVRNDLAKTAEEGSVCVRELCGIYSYKYVHQMISTIESVLHPSFHFIDAIAQAFPMGSMTGAPKIRAMQIIEELETSSRGLYSGAVGYITPSNDFDFNVIIRSILYNQSDKYVSFMAGSAITIASEPDKEYEECLLKAASMAGTLNANTSF